MKYLNWFLSNIVFMTNIYISIYSGSACSLKFDIIPDSDLVGAKQAVTFKQGDDLRSIARKFDLTITEVIIANPQINPKNIKIGTKIIIPTEFILPSGDREGIVLNLAEFRLYHFSKDQKIVNTFPVGIGRLGWKTPLGETKVIRKKANPTWVPPPSIRKHYENKGKILPSSIPPGPDNPLGVYAINLGWTNYLIHGSNAPNSIGLRSSSGCVRMYAEDIEALFNLTDIGIKVRVIHEPFKVGKSNGELYMEVHEAFKEKYYNDEELTEEELLEKVIDEHYKRFKKRIDWGYANKNLQKPVGYPIDITE
jgi:L,D-transpeptidase ErfK/SrfK